MTSPRRYVVAAIVITRTFFMVLLFKLLHVFWPAKLRSFTSWNKNDPESKIQSSMRFISSFNLVSTMARAQWKNLAMTAEEGKPFPDFSLVALNSRREMRLSDLVKGAGARPLVLNFGSCS